MALKRIQVWCERWFFYVYITGLFIVYCNANTVTLSSQPDGFWEDTDVTLTCSYEDTKLTRSFYWYLKRINFEAQTAFVKSDCIVQGEWLNNASQYEYRCHSNTTHSVTLKNITRSRQGEIWQCTVNFGASFGIQSNTAQIFVKVPVNVASISPYNTMLEIPENSTMAWECKSSECRPKPSFRWLLESPYGNSTNLIVKDSNEIASDKIQAYVSNYSFVLNRTWNRWFLSCGANNKDGSQVVLSAKIELNVTYPPDGPPKIRNLEDGNKVVSTVNVIIGGFVRLECSVSGGNPLPRLEWNINNDISQTVSGLLVTKNISFQATSTDSNTELKCQFIQALRETSIVSVNVLYPPETPEITVKTSSGIYVKVTTTLDVIEGTPYTVNCSAKSNPPASLFKWNDLPPSNSSILYVEKADRSHAETVTCNVSNVMQISDTRSAVTGMNITQLIVNVLYPPKVNILRETTIIEGEEINYSCNFTQGNPSVTNITWSRKGSSWDGQHLQLKNVSRNQAGLYRCSVHNIMSASDGSRELGISNGTLNLYVQYKTTILKFIVNDRETNQVTISENDTVNISCEIEGDPIPTGELLHQKTCCNLQEQHQPFEASQQSSNLRLSRIFQAQCIDTGVHICIGNNTFYNGWNSTSNTSFSLFVICSPRKHPFFKVAANVTSALNTTATFHFTAMAYPPPNVQWYQILNGVATSEVRGGVIESISISTNVMQIQFTLKHVEKSHYGEYLLNVTNQYGTFQQRFILVPYGKPSAPTSYDYFPDLISSDSVTIWWEPGFDGGLNQSFIISYNVTATKWHNETAINQSKEGRMSKKITGLASSSQYHILIYAQNEQGAVRVPHAMIVHTKALPIDALQRSINVGAAVGGAVGGMLAILVLVVAVIIMRKRSLGKRAHSRGKCDNSDPHIYSNFSKEMDINTSNVDDKACIRNSKQTALDSPKLPARMPLKLEPKHSLQELDDYDDKAEETIYGNTKDIRKRIERITVSELYPYLTSKTTDFFGLEFQKLPTGLTKPYEFSQKSENIALNRYNGIYPYDHSRVKLADEPTFFINACYINGYRKKKAFIASLGPLARTTYNFVTFWRMVWCEKSDVIVMLTKLKEPSGVKCDQYWPDTDSVLSYGEVTVASLGEDIFADYVMRRFTLTKENKVRKLTQFHFMAWPDKSIPEDVTCLLEFRRRVNVNHSSGPIIVHCSAGIGRTGTLIALEILIEEGQREGSVNVVECVKTMRDQRTSMVQTVDQYYFIYKALVNALVFDCETISVQKFSKYLDKANEDQLSKMFQALNQSVESDLTTESNARTANKMQRDTNRMGSDIPGDSHRVRLFLNRYEETSSDYINAVYTDSFRKNEHFIVAQSPLTDGVEDFLCMIYQVECSCIVSLGDSNQRTNVGSFIPIDDTQPLMIGSFKVICKVIDTKDNYIIRKVKIQFKGRYEEGEKVVYHFEYNDWALSQKTPSDPHKFVSFTLEVEEFASQLGTGKSQVLVHCLNAYERSCLFCAVVTLIEKVKYEGEVCVPNVLRHIRARRRLAIPNMAQFQFCFKAVRAYIALDKTGPNVEEKAYINMALV